MSSIRKTFLRKLLRSTSEGRDYFSEVAAGNVVDQGIVNKWGFNQNVGTTPHIISPWGGVLNPNTDFIKTAQTFTISYNNSTDGDGTTGATSLLFTYLDDSNNEVSAVHVLGSTGSDVTIFTGFGINRCLVLSNGGDGFNNNDITITATIDGSTQAMIPEKRSVTQQPFYFTAIGYQLQLKKIFINALRIGSGTEPTINFNGYSWSRVTNTRYDVFNDNINTEIENHIPVEFDESPLVFGGREVVYFEAESTRTGTSVSLRFMANKRLL